MVRRGNLITASKILGLQVLQKEGGIYLATNVLPEIDEKLFNVGHRSLIQTSIQDPQGVESKAVIASCILDALMEKTDPETGISKILAREKLIKDYPVYNIDSARRTKIETIIQRAIEKKIPLFKSLGVVKVDPFFRCCYADGYAKAVAAKKFDDQEGIPFITHLLSNFAKTYAIIEKYNPLTLKLTEPALRQSLISEIEAEDLLLNKNRPFLGHFWRSFLYYLV
ncbi:TcdA/TcdB catalytic glycosyltransferase domain-containing protein [Candidatus Regiella insecticola]|uniref:TcdA/TcdB catalytic glycosyltransferase domain-containing protein n=1 Tax=Candidatus Regiella insecticola TaxID=138073 RepID=UPI00159717BD|nr:TcdA/TcdB catalytic glycosyltransferase domain-containing protein [Candidatus Regiella insecticola]